MSGLTTPPKPKKGAGAGKDSKKRKKPADEEDSADEAADGRDDEDSTPTSSAKRSKRKSSSIPKGLRHFSLKVCDRLSAQLTSTYNDIANELVAEARGAAGLSPTVSPAANDKNRDFDEKNIRRRIYDALNVLMAMDIITRDGKTIRWNGIKYARDDALTSDSLVAAKQAAADRIAKKKSHLEELGLQFLALKNLMERNSDSQIRAKHKEKLFLPFIVVNTAPTTDINCEMPDDRTTVAFSYSSTFSIHDDNVVLKQLGQEDARDQNSVPEALEPFLASICPEAAARSMRANHVVKLSDLTRLSGSGSSDPPRSAERKRVGVGVGVGVGVDGDVIMEAEPGSGSSSSSSSSSSGSNGPPSAKKRRIGDGGSPPKHDALATLLAAAASTDAASSASSQQPQSQSQSPHTNGIAGVDAAVAPSSSASSSSSAAAAAAPAAKSPRHSQVRLDSPAGSNSASAAAAAAVAHAAVAGASSSVSADASSAPKSSSAANSSVTSS